MNNKQHSVVCVLDVMQMAPEIQACAPPHIAIEYFMECVLLLIEHATSEHDVINKQALALEYVDETMADYDYDEATERGMSDDEYLTWLEVIKGEVVQCTMDIARRMYQRIKPVLTTCGQIYPNGFVMDVQKLSTDGIYTDLMPVSSVPPSNTAG